MNKKIEENFKPRTWLLIILIIIGLCIVVVLINKVIENNKTRTSIFDYFSNVKDNFDDNFDDEYNKISEDIDQMQKEQDISSFNSKFEMKAGTQNGFFVINLIDDIITNNKTKKDHIITVTCNGVTTQDEETIRGFKNNFENTKNYEVILGYDENGYVNSVTIR